MLSCLDLVTTLLVIYQAFPSWPGHMMLYMVAGSLVAQSLATFVTRQGCFACTVALLGAKPLLDTYNASARTPRVISYQTHPERALMISRYVGLVLDALPQLVYQSRRILMV